MKKLDTLHIYCLPGVRDKLTALAESNMRSLSAEVQILIEEAYVKRFGKRPTKTDLKG